MVLGYERQLYYVPYVLADLGSSLYLEVPLDMLARAFIPTMCIEDTDFAHG